jgi:UDP-N-acetylmuramoyl-tripeptide--D-alanyl-D-alanine ligase
MVGGSPSKTPSVAAAGIERLLVFGLNARFVVAGARAGGMDSHRLAEFAEMDALLAVLDCWLAPGDVILVKGSRGMRMERVVEWLRQYAAREFQEHTTPQFERVSA